MISRYGAFLVAAAIGALLITSCGGGQPSGAATATSIPPTSTPVPAPAATPTPALTPTPTLTTPPINPTPTPTLGIPTAVVREPTKRGGTLQLRGLAPGTTAWDTYDVGGGVDFHLFGPMLNNLLWPDPYAKELIGDIAEGWEFSQEGKVITFRIRKGIKFHDGMPLTSRDVLYDIERGWKGRDDRMVQFKTRFSSIQKLEAPDDNTFRVTMAAPSNVLLVAMGTPGVLMYPSHLPFPERKEDWKKAPIGSGPFKAVRIEPAARFEYARYVEYFKPGMPYVDSIVMTVMSNESGVAAFRAGRIDASNLDGTAIEFQIEELKRAHGFVGVQTIRSVSNIELNQRPPFTDSRVRQAVHLAMDRKAMVDIWLRGGGFPVTGPLVPPEFGGQWGLSTKELENRPGFTIDKSKDLARAKELLTEAGVDPAKFTLTIIGNATYPQFAEVTDSGFRNLGFKTTINIPARATEILLRGDFDVNTVSDAFSFDDPYDRLASQVTTGGPFNYGKWSNRKLDTLMEQQDQVLDVAKRKGMIKEIQETVLQDNVFIPVVLRLGLRGYMPYLKNYPTNVPFPYGSAYRWEQVWLER